MDTVSLSAGFLVFGLDVLILLLLVKLLQGHFLELAGSRAEDGHGVIIPGWVKWFTGGLLLMLKAFFLLLGSWVSISQWQLSPAGFVLGALLAMVFIVAGFFLWQRK